MIHNLVLDQARAPLTPFAPADDCKILQAAWGSLTMALLELEHEKLYLRHWTEQMYLRHGQPSKGKTVMMNRELNAWKCQELPDCTPTLKHKMQQCTTADFEAALARANGLTPTARKRLPLC